MYVETVFGTPTRSRTVRCDDFVGLETTGEMECRMGDFASSSRTLDQALSECPTYGRAREVIVVQHLAPGACATLGNVYFLS